MGAEREDTDPKPNRVANTDPGLGPAGTFERSPHDTDDAVVEVSSADDDGGGPAAVDFDALHAALGDPLDFDELPPPAQAADELDDQDADDHAATPAPRGKPVRGGESSGQSSAQYASARPHTIPPTRAPNEDLNAPAVIVATEDTVPTAAPQMTVPLAPPPPPLAVPQVPHPHGAMRPGNAQHASGPHLASPPSSTPHLAAGAPGYAATPPSFQAQRQLQAQHQMTMRMPERPINPRRPRTETVVVRARSGPSPKQKLIAFGAMLVLVTAAGIAIIVVQRPSWLGLGAIAPASPSAEEPSSAVTAAPPPSVTPSAAPSSAPSSAVSASASSPAPAVTSPKVRPKAPPAPRAPAP